jgi:hypothetical protein
MNRVVLTLNRRHFVRLHLLGQPHSGIIVGTYDPPFEAQAQRIDEAILSFSELTGQLIRINRPSVADA